MAKAKGLDGLAEYILAQTAQDPVTEEAAKYVTTEDVKEDSSRIFRNRSD